MLGGETVSMYAGMISRVARAQRSDPGNSSALRAHGPSLHCGDQSVVFRSDKYCGVRVCAARPRSSLLGQQHCVTTQLLQARHRGDDRDRHSRLTTHSGG